MVDRVVVYFELLSRRVTMGTNPALATKSHIIHSILEFLIFVIATFYWRLAEFTVSFELGLHGGQRQ